MTITLKIKLNHGNEGKLRRLDYIAKKLEFVGADYLAFRKTQLDAEVKTNRRPNKEKYAEYRKLYPKLNSAILQTYMYYMESLIKTYQTNCRKKHRQIKFPEVKKIVIPLRNDCFHIKDSDNSFDKWLIFLRNLKLPFNVESNKQAMEVLPKTTKFGDSKLVKQDGVWTLCLSCEVAAEANPNLDPTKVLGVDIGIVHPIVCSDGFFVGNGKLVVHKKMEFRKHRAKQQSQDKKDLSFAKQGRWNTDIVHKFSKQLIYHAVSTGAGVLGIEGLKGQELANRKYRGFAWSFADLSKKIAYKAELAGIKVISVDPHYTSQTCRVCGHQEESNRLSQGIFSCVSCGHTENADVNAAKNIRDKAIAHIANGVNVNPPTGKALNLEKHISNELC